ncbi:hypothetical protein QBC35DRAFT_394743 [Podospora australis]|uniref:C2H2-type domain-containing protein n=1 Tax=Podospora australis TaxID=1536484 RepID=A0AAN7AC01_9PEZI|nr:hypothetical protein QBC35DRAFT_394743 [Podospora australis]
MNTISTRVRDCVDCLKSLQAVLEDDANSPHDATVPAGISPSDADNHLSIFKIWAGNIGAHRTGRSSLEHKLRDASNIRKQVINLLGDLAESVQDAISIIRGEMVRWDDQQEQDSPDFDTCSDKKTSGFTEALGSDFIEGYRTELSQISTGIAEVIDCLFRLSESIRHPAPHDRFKARGEISTLAIAPHDIAHVKEKFPSADDEVLTRLGFSNACRRQYLWYREDHHKKLAAGLEASVAEDAGISTIASSIPQQAKSMEGAASPTEALVEEDQRSDSDMTQTSYGSFDMDGRPKVPPLPSSAHSGPFECPLCFMIISATTTQAWRCHVFSDLRPYICLSDDCDTPREDYGRRRDWMQHVKSHHWRTWSCPLCYEAAHSARGLNDHLAKNHSLDQETLSQQFESALMGVTGPITMAVLCPLCHQSLTNLKEYIRHVGRHQEDVALFVLPTMEYDADDIESESYETDDSETEDLNDVSGNSCNQHELSC